MLLAYEVVVTPEVRSYVEKVNIRLSQGTASLFFSGKVSIKKNLVFVNVRYWLLNIGLFKLYYSWAFVKGLRRAGYVGDVKRLSSEDVSKFLELLLC